MLSSTMTRITFSATRELNKIHLRRFFNKSQQSFNAAKDQLYTSLAIPPMSKKLVTKIFEQHPKVFVPTTKPYKLLEGRIKLLNQLAKKYELAKIMIEVMYKNRFILFKTTDEQISNLCKVIHQEHGLTNSQVRKIFSSCYRLINPSLPTILCQKLILFSQYLHLSPSQSISLIQTHPFLLASSTLRLKQAIVLFLGKCNSHSNHLLSLDKVIDFLRQYPEIFILGRHQIKDMINIYKDWGLQDDEVWKIVLQNPILLNNHSNQVMPKKRKLFRYFKFTKQMGRKMLLQYPLVLISSISSLEAKLIFLRDRLKLPIKEQTLPLLQYKFCQIRPRGQLLVRAKQPYTLQNIISQYINISDQEFAKKLNITIERYNQEKDRFKDTDQLDFRRRKVLKGSGVEQRLIQEVRNIRNQFRETKQ